MPRELKKIAFVVEEFSVPSPAQQLLDRFLIGYPRDGRFHRPEGCRVAAHLTPGANDVELRRRAGDFGLTLAGSVKEAVADADGVVIVWRDTGAVANDAVLREVLECAAGKTVCFVHGVLAESLSGARAMMKLAASRNIALLSGTPLGVTWRLPEFKLPAATVLKEALVVVQGDAPSGELDGLECLAPVIEGRRGGEVGWRRIRHLEGPAVWRGGDEGAWSWPLLASAISRSDMPQGDAVTDGRTQDLVGLGLVPKLAQSPRAWLIEHQDGLRSSILVLDGVVGDYNFAVQTAGGRIYSAQIYRPPSPGQHHFSELARALEELLRSGSSPWSAGRSVLIAGGLEAFANPRTRSGKWEETRELKTG